MYNKSVKESVCQPKKRIFIRYDTRNFEKWEEREAYISEYFDLDLEAIAKEVYEG